MCQNKKKSILKQNSIHDLLFLQNTKIYQTYSRETILLCQRLPIIWNLPLFHVGPLFAIQRLHWRGIRNRVESFKAHISFLRGAGVERGNDVWQGVSEHQSSQQVNLLRNFSFFEFIFQTFLRTLSYLGKCAKLIKFEGEYEYFYA